MTAAQLFDAYLAAGTQAERLAIARALFGTAPRWSPRECAAQGHSPGDHIDAADVA